MPFNKLPLEIADGSGRVWSFAGREFDESRLELRVAGRPIELELKPLEVLIELLKNPGKVATKEQLLNAVWPGLSVVEGSLTTAIHKLRRALSDDDSTIVVTVPRVGYRLAASVQNKGVDHPLAPQLNLAAGHPVPGRDSWTLLRPLSGLADSQVWLTEHSKSREVRVFKFATDATHLRALKREVTVSRFLRESLGERSDLVRIFEWNFDKPPYFLESEYGGLNLKEWSESQGGLANIPMQRRLGVLAKIARTIALAHDAGVLHMDLKPANILLQVSDAGEQIKIADFGSATLADPSRLGALNITRLGLTQPNINPSLSGTLMYLAPEVICGTPPTAAADIYALGIMLYQLVTGDFRKPLSADWERTVEDPLIREDIAIAACGDPALRLGNAGELAERISALEQRRIGKTRLEEARKRELVAERRRAEARVRRPWLVLASVAVLTSATSLFWLTRPSPKSPAGLSSRLNTVAILPLQNAGSDHAFDFLSQSVPDEVATSLSYARSISVRSFAATSKYTQASLDPQTVGNELKVASVITGHFIDEGDNLEFALEAIDVKTGRVFWRDTFTTPGRSLIQMRKKLDVITQGTLAASLGASAFTVNSSSRPKSEEAYNLYLRAAALPMDTAKNQQAIMMLERSVGLDSKFAPSWLILGRRYYLEGRYGNGGQTMMEHSEASEAQALALDPNYIAAGANVTVNRLERGDLVGAFREAEDLVHRRPDSADAHHSLGAVYRYAGLLDDSSRECDTAFRIDPHTQTSGLRSCAIVFALLGKYQRATDYLNLDPTSDFHRAMLLTTLLREGNTREALQVEPPHIPQWASYDVLLAYAQRRPVSDVARLAATVQTSDDPEANYLAASNLAYCGQIKEAARLLRLAIRGNYCSYPAMDSDPFFARLRTVSQFPEIRRAGLACQQNFLKAREHLQ